MRLGHEHSQKGKAQSEKRKEPNMTTPDAARLIAALYEGMKQLVLDIADNNNGIQPAELERHIHAPTPPGRRDGLATLLIDELVADGRLERREGAGTGGHPRYFRATPNHPNEEPNHANTANSPGLLPLPRDEAPG